MTNPKPIIWTISGSDCSGGAGIAADIKTGHGLGVEVCHLITANTVQNSHQLMAVNPVGVDILQQQVAVLTVDKPPAVIKIGLLATLAQVTWLTSKLAQLKQQLPKLIVVYDPVGQASVGGSFNGFSLNDLTPLLQQIDVITPNLMEANTLVDAALQTQDKQLKPISAELLAKNIYQNFAINSIIIKGGHSNDSEQCVDFCYHQLNQLKQDNQEKTHHLACYQLRSPRIKTHYSHGGGCCFASAISAFLAQGYLVRDAFTLAKAFINQGLAATSSLSSAQQHNYYGAFEPLTWPSEAQYFPTIVSNNDEDSQQLAAFPSLELKKEKLGLYPVVSSLYWLQRLLPLGLNIIQLRVKNLPLAELEHTIKETIELAKNYSCRLFINDYWQLAIKHGAYGVHIGQEDLAEADLAKIQQAGLRLGISTHGCYEFLLAQQLQPSYLAVGAIFPTKTKDMTGQIQGIENLRQLLALRSKSRTPQLSTHDDDAYIPVVAIGGISLARASQVLATAVDSIAVVTAITEATQPELAVEKFKQLISLSYSK
ncbi:phosphomethylpyrimidine kinase [Colwellia sp. 39_35_sub15_T18]|nr:phosphomethylpyrimidine kinase [Colwellia sp. 39_35_sub15_T18]